MDQKTDLKQKMKNGLKMDNGLEDQLKRINNTLFAKLAVRNCQYKIAIEGLRAIEEFGDINVAVKTIEAMMDCVPDNS
mgnify:CR=1 FL=1